MLRASVWREEFRDLRGVFIRNGLVKDVLQRVLGQLFRGTVAFEIGMIRCQRFDRMQSPEAVGSGSPLTGPVLLHTKVDHLEEFAS